MVRTRPTRRNSPTSTQRATCRLGKPPDWTKRSAASGRYSSMKNWVSELTERVVRGELSKEKAAAQIQSHFER
jgi:hypothetical protein